MAQNIGGIAFSEIRFDEQGDIDRDGERVLLADVDAVGPTDIVVFCHGWNNTPSQASNRYRLFFELFPGLLGAHGEPGRSLLLLGVYWPSVAWTDEPIGDFEAAVARGGAAGFDRPTEWEPPPPPDEDLRKAIRAAFPKSQRDAVDEVLTLLVERPDDADELQRARDLLAKIARATKEDGDDGEVAGELPFIAQEGPDDDLFDRFAGALEEVDINTGGSGPGGAAGFGDSLKRLWHGAQQALRQLTFWQMKNRAGVVGENGLGPLLGRLLVGRPGLRIHVIGHSFGARVVSYSLKVLPVDVDGREPVQSVTLLQGAFSHFVFAAKLPFDVSRSGALSGQQVKVAGPVVACYSKHDTALGIFYPLASLASGADAAGVEREVSRWGAIGFDGHHPDVDQLGILDVGTKYDFAGRELVSIDASRVVDEGPPPSGAHSDIIHKELAWVVLSVAGLV